MTKTLFFIPFLIIAMMLVAGCSSSDNQPMLSDQQIAEQPTDGTTPASSSTIISTHIVPTRTSVIPNPARPQASLGTLCGELVTCGDLPASSGVAPISSTRCPQLDIMVIHHDRSVTQCFINSYTGTTNGKETWNVEYIKLLCSKGIGSRGSCEKYGATLLKK